MDAPPSTGSRIASRTLQVVLAAVVVAGASRDVMITLPLYGVAILAVPPVLGRLCGHRFGPVQRVWFGLGLAVHPVGAIYGLYRSVWWYDHLAHAASASLLAGFTYLVASSVLAGGRIRDLPSVGHVAVLGVVVCSGVAWELFELQVSYLHVAGPEDTLADLAYDVVGWLAVAPRGHRLLDELPRRLAERVPSGSTVGSHFSGSTVGPQYSGSTVGPPSPWSTAGSPPSGSTAGSPPTVALFSRPRQHRVPTRWP